jgi:hypothetical protein
MDSDDGESAWLAMVSDMMVEEDDGGRNDKTP